MNIEVPIETATAEQLRSEVLRLRGCLDEIEELTDGDLLAQAKRLRSKLLNAEARIDHIVQILEIIDFPGSTPEELEESIRSLVTFYVKNKDSARVRDITERVNTILNEKKNT